MNEPDHTAEAELERRLGLRGTEGLVEEIPARGALPVWRRVSAASTRTMMMRRPGRPMPHIIPPPIMSCIIG